MYNELFDPKSDPVVILEDDKGRIEMGNLPRVISVNNLDRSERSELEFDVERYFRTYSNPRRIDDYVFIAIAEANKDLVSRRELRAMVGTYFDDVQAMIASAEEYCLYTVDQDRSQLLKDDLIELAIDYALAYIDVCGLTGEMYNNNKMDKHVEPKTGIFLTKIGHVLREMLFGTSERVSIG